MRSLRILLIEDDATISALLAEVLEGLGHVICGLEATEADAVGSALRVRPDLMIVDANLRIGSGIAAVATIARSIAIPSIFISGDRLPASVGTANFLQKPFTCRDLVGAIERTAGEVQAGAR